MNWTERGLDACTACVTCKGNAPINPDDVIESAIDEDESEAAYTIAQVEQIIIDEEREYESELYEFVYCWKETLAFIKTMQNNRFQAWIKSHYEK